MTRIVLELKGVGRVGTAAVSPAGDVHVEATDRLLGPRLAKEIRALIQEGPLLERSGEEQTLPDGSRRFVTTARVCQPGEPAYHRALAQRIGFSAIRVGERRLLAHVED